jgi:hypothetical protein
MGRKSRLKATAALLAILTFAVYRQVRGFDFINFDDDLYVTNNVVVQKGITGEGIRYAMKSMDVKGVAHLPRGRPALRRKRRRHSLHERPFHVANTLLLSSCSRE